MMPRLIPRWQGFDSREELEKEYYALLEKLREAGRICSVLLNVGIERFHSWAAPPQI